MYCDLKYFIIIQPLKLVYKEIFFNFYSYSKNILSSESGILIHFNYQKNKWCQAYVLVSFLNNKMIMNHISGKFINSWWNRLKYNSFEFSEHTEKF